MNYATGAAFNLAQLFMNFKLSRLKMTCNDCKAITGSYHREVYITTIFKYCFELVIQDIIENDVNFNLPTGIRKSYLRMNRQSGEDFKDCRRCGKYQDIDFLESNFSGYQIRFFMWHPNRPTRSKIVYVSAKLKKKITDYTNNRKQYYGKLDRVPRDYYTRVFKAFPFVEHTDIVKIINYGWRSYYLHNSYGGDVLIKNNSDFWSYTGKLMINSLEYRHYYRKKLCTKLRILYKRKRIKWDGYYYFGLTKLQYEKYMAQKKKRGRPKKWFNFEHLYLYKSLDECCVANCNSCHIFRIPYVYEMSMRLYRSRAKICGFEEIITRDAPLKFKDMLVDNTKYSLL